MQMVKGSAVFLRHPLALVVAFYLLNQMRKPTRWVGRFFLWVMNISHSRLTAWGLQHVRIEKDCTILDVDSLIL